MPYVAIKSIIENFAPALPAKILNKLLAA